MNQETEIVQDQDADKKCYVLMLQSHLPKGHPRAGKKTDFESLVARGVKIHTFRENYHELKRQAMNINNGLAYMSLRVWTGKPYNSPQREVKRLYKIEVQYVLAKIEHGLLCITIDGKLQHSPWAIASSDGLSHDDMQHWLCYKEKPFKGCLVQFTDHKY